MSVAKALAQHGIDEWGDETRELILGAPILSFAAATSLAKHRGASLIFSLREISEQVAEALSSYRGYLRFEGLISLPASVASAFSKHEGGIYFGGQFLRDFSDEAAWTLSLYRGRLGLELTSLSDEQAKALSHIKGRLVIYGLKSISDPATQILFADRKRVCLRP